MLEKELKYRLSKKEYLKLINAVRNNSSKELSMTNHYFDSGSFILYKNRIALRVRFIKGQESIITLKLPTIRAAKTNLKSLSVRVEHEEPVPHKVMKKIFSKKFRLDQLKLNVVEILKNKIPTEVINELKPIGSLECRRTISMIGSGQKKIKFEIDSCQVLNKSFFELEVETNRPRHADQVVKSLFKVHDINYRPQTMSKLDRFMKALKSEKIPSDKALRKG